MTLRRWTIAIAAFSGFSSSAVYSQEQFRSPTSATVFDAYVSAIEGVGFGTLKSGSRSFEDDGPQATLRAAAVMPLGPVIGFQVDGVLSREWTAIDNLAGHIPHPRNSTSVAGHLFGRDEYGNALGVIGQFTALRESLYYPYASFIYRTDHNIVGGEAQGVVGKFTITGSVAYHHASGSSDTAWLAFDRVSGNGWIASAKASYAATENLLLSLKPTVDAIKLGFRDDDGGEIKQTTIILSAVAEYAPSNSPVSLFAELSYSNAHVSYFGRYSYDIGGPVVRIGATVPLGGVSITDRRRHGASFDPFELRSIPIGDND